LIPATTRRTGRLAMPWVAAAAVSLSLLGPAPAASASTTHLSVAADPMTVHVGSRIVLSGKATPRTATPVYLQRYVAGHWKNLSHHITSATGAYSFSIKAPGKPATWIFRVSRSSSVSHSVHVKVSAASFHVKASTTAKVPAGKPLVVTGSVSPKATGSVRLQILRGKRWATLASAALTKKSTFTIRAIRPAGAYQLRVLKPFTATIATGVSATKTVAVVATNPPITTTTASLSVSSPDDASLGLSGPRLVFSAVRGQQLPPARSFTLTNTGGADATVTGLAISGPDASSYGLAAGQPTTLTVPAGGTASVAVQFHPTAPTNCPSTASPYGVSGSNRNATLTFASNDAALPTGSADLSGVISCGFGGANEPVLHQIVQALGYSTVVDTAGMDQRFLKMQGIYPGTDEVSVPYFQAADPSKPVSLTDLAHYSSPNTSAYHSTGWFPKGAALPSDGSCNTSCHQAWIFPADPSSTTYNQNQKLMPSTIGASTFTPSGAFGLYAGDNKDVVFSWDGLNDPTAQHDIRVYPAYGAGHVRIPNAYLVAVDTGRVSESKNADYQDIVMIIRNVIPG
jgi:hypothetical protein